MEHEYIPPKPKISLPTAIAIGQIVVNLPVLLTLCFGGLVLVVSVVYGYVWGYLAFIFIFFGAWLWWSFTVPRWRMWALKRGVDAYELQKWGVVTGLLWPKGVIFERTELRPKDFDDGLGESPVQK